MEQSRQIIEGGCHHGPQFRPPASRLSWVIIAAIVLIGIVAAIVAHK
jgi:hypothetical protein